MTSKLTEKEFALRFRDLTIIGEPAIMGSPFAIFTIFNSSDKPFYGEFEKGQFRLTRNSIMPFCNSGYIINGDYSKSDNGTNVNYKIQPIWFPYLGARIGPLLFGIVINLAFYFSRGPITIKGILLINGFLLLIGFITIQFDLFTKRRLEKRFQEEFEIELDH